jgi:hypothetical protein
MITNFELFLPLRTFKIKIKNIHLKDSIHVHLKI